MSQSVLFDDIRRLLDPVLTGLALELVELEFKREGRDWCLRLFIDKPGGVTLDDCAALSREFGSVLEIEDLIETSYRLEVSSPGIDRPLHRPEDYRRFAGERVKVKTIDRMDPDGRGHSRKTFTGRLLGLEGEAIRILQLDKPGGEVLLPITAIAKANLDPEF